MYIHVYTHLAGYEMQVWYVNGLYERAVGCHPNLESVGHECQHVGSHANCKACREGR